MSIRISYSLDWPNFINRFLWFLILEVPSCIPTVHAMFQIDTFMSVDIEANCLRTKILYYIHAMVN